jgi:hypothetical protein
MPYIKIEERRLLDTYIDELIEKLVDIVHFGETGDGLLAGRLNYTITKLILGYIEFAKEHVDFYGVGYSDWNEIMGALECAKLEIYRMQIAPYEDIKIKENGPVIPKIEKKTLKQLKKSVKESKKSFEDAISRHNEDVALSKLQTKHKFASPEELHQFLSTKKGKKEFEKALKESEQNVKN